MPNIAIKAENLGKAYQLGQIGTGTISRDLERWYARVRGKEDPFLRIGEKNDRSVKGVGDVVWSLRDLNFEIEQGDAVGIIGRNGAGKSTLLKILSKVTAPTTGKISGHGRIASLLEVGTGFHPELSGRENIFLNGAILGMRKKEIERKFDEIVDFAGIERYIDTPVKRYSSGMYVRLAFAVAAHLESEILIVDEVLAVGDAEFQKKCLGKMGEVSKGEGRTVLFVSHNIGSIQQLCNQSIILEQGLIAYKGTSTDGLRYYLNSQKQNSQQLYQIESHSVNQFLEVKVTDDLGQLKEEFSCEENIYIRLAAIVDNSIKGAKISIRFTDNQDRIIFTTEQNVSEIVQEDNILKAKIEVPKNILTPNTYKITLALHIPNIQMLDLLSEVLNFKIIESGSSLYHYSGSDFGCVFISCNWENYD